MNLIIKFSIIAFFFILAACGKESSLSSISYKIEKQHTNNGENVIIIDVSEKDYLFSLSGEGFSSDVELGKPYPVQHETKLYFDDYKEYSVELAIFQSDGTMLLSDTLTFVNSSVVPIQPTFSLPPATNKKKVKVIFASNRQELITEYWLEGDIDPSFQASPSWHEIPASGSFYVDVSAEEGEKSIRIKYRNEFGNESPLVEEVTQYKLTQPKNCQVIPRSKDTNNGKIDLYLSAENSGSLSYRIRGDIISTKSFQKFENHTFTTISLTPLEDGGLAEPRKIRVQIKDEAENYCEDTFLELNHNPDSKLGSLAVKDHVHFTNTRDISLEVGFPILPNEEIEMQIAGPGVTKSENTHTWIPFQKSFDATLVSTINANHNISVKFRKNNIEFGSTVYYKIFLQPSVHLLGNGPDFLLALSAFANLSYLTITGCQQEYQNVEFSRSYRCIPEDEAIVVDYIMEDGSIVTITKELDGD